MTPAVDDVRKHLGELGAMANQTVEAERKILTNAEEMLGKVQSQIPAARAKALTGGADAYQELVAERGRLEQVIASARHNLR